MSKPFYKLNIGNDPLMITAIHNGHFVPNEIMPYMALNEQSRMYEEDPYTGFLTDISDSYAIGLYSRFVIDLNRKKQDAIYLNPDQAWGLNVWKMIPPSEVLKMSYDFYNDFYKQMEIVIHQKIVKYGYAIVYDIHSYNYKREGKEANKKDNPDINIGTNGMDRQFWEPVINSFIDEMKGAELYGKKLDVRENIKFKGGYFPTWINTNFKNKACAIAIEVKKIFMDERTGEVDTTALSEIKKALNGTVLPVLKSSSKLFEQHT